jgi:hypothetical protein
MEDAEFRAGAIEIQWLERRLDSLVGAAPPAATERIAAVVAALIAERDRTSPKRSGGARPDGAPVGGGDVWTRAARQEGLR